MIPVATFHQFALPEESIYVVDNLTSFENFLRCGLQVCIHTECPTNTIQPSQMQKTLFLSKFVRKILRMDCLKWDTRYSFYTCMLFQGVDVVGIDCEWKPSFGVNTNALALMQIATRQAVFILDVIKLGSSYVHLWHQLGDVLFNNCDILKLGRCSFYTSFSLI